MIQNNTLVLFLTIPCNHVFVARRRNMWDRSLQQTLTVTISECADRGFPTLQGLSSACLRREAASQAMVYPNVILAYDRTTNRARSVLVCLLPNTHTDLLEIQQRQASCGPTVKYSRFEAQLLMLSNPAIRRPSTRPAKRAGASIK